MICMSADCGRWRVRSSGLTSNSAKQCYFYHFNRTAMIVQCYSIRLPFKHIIDYFIAGPAYLHPVYPDIIHFLNYPDILVFSGGAFPVYFSD
jgi:hypothetical protein